MSSVVLLPEPVEAALLTGGAGGGGATTAGRGGGATTGFAASRGGSLGVDTVGGACLGCGGGSLKSFIAMVAAKFGGLSGSLGAGPPSPSTAPHFAQKA